MKRLLMLVAALLASSFPALAAGIVVPAEGRYIPYSGDIPQCGDPDALAWIQARFASMEAIYWDSWLKVENIDEVREIGFRSNGVQFIPRRFCTARAHMSDLKTHRVVYQIQESGGFAGYAYGVEWCVVGLDHNNAYAPACAILQPLFVRYSRDRANFPPVPGRVRGNNPTGGRVGPLKAGIQGQGCDGLKFDAFRRRAGSGADKFRVRRRRPSASLGTARQRPRAKGIRAKSFGRSGSMFFKSLVLAFLAFLGLATAARAAAPELVSNGDFDFYVLTLSWSPGFCDTGGADKSREQCAAGAGLGFVVHGLWPENADRPYPSDCSDPGSIPGDALRETHGLYPAEGLARYEYRKHGTCTGLSPENYFHAVKYAREN